MEQNRTETPLFSLKKVSKVFPGSSGGEAFEALRDITLDIFAGQCLLVAGSNGSGKTLLMRIIAGLMEPSEGEVIFSGGPIRRELGLVFQDPDAQILGETVAEDAALGPENLGFSQSEIRRRTEAALEAMGLSDKGERSPRRLSGGEKRRLAIAGILAMGCNTFILDEPFANLDWPGVVQTLKVIEDLKKNGKTLIILTHELEKALALSDRLLILHRGRVRADGLPQTVLDNLDVSWGVRDPRRGYARVEDCSWLE